MSSFKCTVKSLGRGHNIGKNYKRKKSRSFKYICDRFNKWRYEKVKLIKCQGDVYNKIKRFIISTRT